MSPFTVQWFLNDAEVYRYVPKARRELQRMVFNREAVRIDLESSKMIGEREHLLVLQSVARKQVGESTRRAATTIRDQRRLLYAASILNWDTCPQVVFNGKTRKSEHYLVFAEWGVQVPSDNGHPALPVHTGGRLPQHHGLARETPSHIR